MWVTAYPRRLLVGSLANGQILLLPPRFYVFLLSEIIEHTVTMKKTHNSLVLLESAGHCAGLHRPHMASKPNVAFRQFCNCRGTIWSELCRHKSIPDRRNCDALGRFLQRVIQGRSTFFVRFSLSDWFFRLAV